MLSKMFMYFFLQWKINEVFWWKHSRICIHIVIFNGLQTVEGQNDSFSAASKSYKQYQTINKCLIYRNDQWLKKIKQMYMLYKHTNARLCSMCVPDFT